MFTTAFLLATIERAIKTLAQTAAALLVADGTGLLNTDWLALLSVAGMAAVVSVLTSIGTGAVTDGSPSAIDAEVLADDGSGLTEPDDDDLD